MSGACAEVERPKLRDAVAEAGRRLRAAGVETPELDARLLVMEAASVGRAALIADDRRALANDEAWRLEAMIARREAREPVAYILGRREFWSMEFETPHGVLVPRPDSETLVEAAIELCDNRPPRRIVDLGTGTGCLLVALLSAFPEAVGIGVDRSAAAVACARRNAARLGFGARAEFLEGDWFSPLEGEFDLIVSNPPYIADDEYAVLAPEILRYEPKGALVAGRDGLDAYKQILTGAGRCLTPKGAVLVEIGASQAEAVAKMISLTLPRARIRRFEDLAGRPRCVSAELP